MFSVLAVEMLDGLEPLDCVVVGSLLLLAFFAIYCAGRAHECCRRQRLIAMQSGALRRLQAQLETEKSDHRYTAGLLHEAQMRLLWTAGEKAGHGHGR